MLNKYQGSEFEWCSNIREFGCRLQIFRRQGFSRGSSYVYRISRIPPVLYVGGYGCSLVRTTFWKPVIWVNFTTSSRALAAIFRESLPYTP